MKEFAEQLRTTRETKGLSHADIASKTKIQLKYLHAMEEGDFSFLPPPYVRAFIRDYAEALDLDPNEVLRQYDLALGSEAGTPEAQHPSRKPLQLKSSVEDEASELRRSIFLSLWLSFREFLKEDRIRKKLVPGISVLILLLVLILIVEMAKNSRRSPTPETPFEQILKEKEQPLTTHVDSVEIAPPHPVSAAGNDSLVLEGRTVRKVWMRIYVDDHPPADYLLQPNVHREWKARSKFRVSLGDAGGISFKIGGKDLGTLGKSGAVVQSVLITQDGVQR